MIATVLIEYLLISSANATIIYSCYKFFFQQNNNFKALRLYLVGTLLISVLLPFNSYVISLPEINLTHSSPNRLKEITIPNAEKTKEITPPLEKINNEQVITNVTSSFTNYNWITILEYIYFIITASLLLRIFWSLSLIIYWSYLSQKENKDTVTIYYNKKFKATFSFFHLVFVPSEIKSNKEFDSILTHEKIHATQLHSFDILLIEVITAFTWFNPFIWLIKKDIQLIHEFLADDGVLSAGINKQDYQKLLINQVAEEQLISISSNFNHSLIKKRILMMTKKNKSKSKASIIGLILISSILFFAISCKNEEFSINTVNAVSATKMNVVYMGFDNPIKVATSGYDSKDIQVTVDNGEITGSNGNYNVKPTKNVDLKITSTYKGKKIGESDFRVKRVPVPTSSLIINGKKYYQSATISLNEFVNADMITLATEMKNFEFDDFNIKLLEYKVSYFIKNRNIVEERTLRNKSFAIKDLKSFQANAGEKIFIEGIRVAMPDGTSMNLSPIILKIV